VDDPLIAYRARRDIFFTLMHPASAQWQGKAGLGARAVAHTEYDAAGRRLVRESGWLPGLALDAAYRSGKLSWSGAAEWYRADIAYRGQTQTGVGAESTTATTLASVRLGAIYALDWDVSITAALEADVWRRDIHGTGAALGLQERYRSERFILGIGKAWHPATGVVTADLSALFSTPERMRVGFSGLLDTASLETRHARGLRLGASLRPSFAPALEVRGSYDWIRIGRSGDVPVTRNGQFAGTVAQPEHVRQGLTLTVSRLF
jgi:hypothetical protein